MPNSIFIFEEPTEPLPECSACGRVRHDSHLIDGAILCEYCVIYCPQCPDSDPTPVGSARYIGSNYYCQNHSPACTACGERPEDLYRIGQSDFCYGCAPRCSDCSDILSGDDDSYCESCARGELRYYGKTHPVMWLGGEAPFHLGIELEVTASRSANLRSIKAWSEENLDSRQALDLKEDSSVRGFEIVTQPMTPEFFEGVNWDSFFEMLDRVIPATSEPDSHGMHVHISKSAFIDDVAVASFCYLLAGEPNVENMIRISRRQPTGYCEKVLTPVGSAIVGGKKRSGAQYYKLRGKSVYAGRDAINLQNSETVEIRSPKSTRDPQEFRDTVRMVYLAAQYIRSLRPTAHSFVSPKALHWDRFAEWVRNVTPDYYAAIAG